VRLYYLLVSLVYLICALLFWSGMLPGLLMLLVTSVALIGPISQLKSSPGQRIKLTSLTGRFYLLFGATYLATLWSGLP
ncbi:MAG: hypothetical protein KZQ82_18680, partial [Candidatus Thiodiazotropha sp. (ex Lucinoma annulata)]|nr:hypothetical protein [Candidatus Thiodiazotropha sp. (ex Lucinoma annulata)]